MTRLPAAGREGAAPKWPMIEDVVLTAKRDAAASKVDLLEYELDEASPDKRPGVERRLDVAREKLAILNAQLAAQRRLETSLWRDLWKLPQAAEWERLGWLRDVAQYVRHKVLAELGEIEDAREARQWSDRLGLTPLALLRLRWRIDSADEEAPTGPAGPPQGARTRYAGLQIVAGGKKARSA
jgi:hypothetical protein